MIHPSHLFLLSIWKMTFEEQIVLGGGSYKRMNSDTTNLGRSNVTMCIIINIFFCY